MPSFLAFIFTTISSITSENVGYSKDHVALIDIPNKRAAIIACVRSWTNKKNNKSAAVNPVPNM